MVTSATLDGEKFSKYFMSCPVFHVSRSHTECFIHERRLQAASSKYAMSGLGTNRHNCGWRCVTHVPYELSRVPGAGCLELARLVWQIPTRRINCRPLAGAGAHVPGGNHSCAGGPRPGLPAGKVAVAVHFWRQLHRLSSPGVYHDLACNHPFRSPPGAGSGGHGNRHPLQPAGRCEHLRLCKLPAPPSCSPQVQMHAFSEGSWNLCLTCATTAAGHTLVWY